MNEKDSSWFEERFYQFFHGWVIDVIIYGGWNLVLPYKSTAKS